MLVHVSLDGDGPLHAQLTRGLRELLQEGRLGEGERLPATRLLARELGVSRNTVLAAYEQLQAEGYLRNRVGSGSYVAPGVGLRASAGATVAGTVRELPPQSAYAARARRFHCHARLPGRPVPDCRYAFQYGMPMANPRLGDAWARELARAARFTPQGYPYTQGMPALRQAVARYLARRRGIRVDAEEILIVNGTQQGLSLSARVLLDPGDHVLLEEPHYFAMGEIMQIHGASIQLRAVDAAGLRTDELPLPAPRLVCVTPSHQFPAGAVLSLSRRQQLLDYARQQGTWILEDDYDGEFRYDTHPLPALRSLDVHGQVIYVGSFSKLLFPALRLGFLVMPPALREDFINAKWADDFGSSAIEQAALANFMDSGGFERHLRHASGILRKRRHALLGALRRHAHGQLEVDDSHAGTHLVAWWRGRGPEDLDALIALAAQQGLGLHAITPFYHQPPPRAGLLMGYAGLPAADIDPAVRLLAHCLRQVPATQA